MDKIWPHTLPHANDLFVKCKKMTCINYFLFCYKSNGHHKTYEIKVNLLSSIIKI